MSDKDQKSSSHKSNTARQRARQQIKLHGPSRKGSLYWAQRYDSWLQGPDYQMWRDKMKVKFHRPFTVEQALAIRNIAAHDDGSIATRTNEGTTPVDKAVEPEEEDKTTVKKVEEQPSQGN
ncbi:hypothetical protein PT974_10780 [Cladobotryum mycophilum]|uniref:Uncharacterized protein n=1 Tax=Cladobotryum mycophilum TaxID=491253 RepID=A0ABR0SBX6_9HYPO